MLHIKKLFMKFLFLLIAVAKPVFATTTAPLVKLIASFRIALLAAPVVYLIDVITGWTADNKDYVAIVLFAIAVDHILGSIRHLFFDKDFTWKKNVYGLVIKTTLVVLVGTLFENLNHLAGDYATIAGYTTNVLRLTIFFYPFGSAVGSSRVISGGKFPPNKWYEKFEKWIDEYGGSK